MCWSWLLVLQTRFCMMSQCNARLPKAQTQAQCLPHRCFAKFFVINAGDVLLPAPKHSHRIETFLRPWHRHIGLCIESPGAEQRTASPGAVRAQAPGNVDDNSRIFDGGDESAKGFLRPASSTHYVPLAPLPIMCITTIFYTHHEISCARIL